MKKESKGFAVGALPIVIALALFAVGYFVFSQEKQKTPESVIQKEEPQPSAPAVPTQVLPALQTNGAPLITVTAPKKDAGFLVDDTVNIEWKSQGNVGTGLDIDLMYGDFPGAIAERIAVRVPTNGSYSWKIPANLQPGDYKIYLQSTPEVQSPAVYAYSDDIRIFSSDSNRTSVSTMKTFLDSVDGFSFTYPASYVTDSGDGVYDENRLVTLKASGPSIDFAEFYVSRDENEDAVSSCYDAPYANSVKTKIMNGQLYYVLADKMRDSAMGGQRGETSEYRIVHGGYCYSLDSIIAWHEPGYAAYTRTGVSDASPSEIQSQKDEIATRETELDGILSHLRFSNQD